MACEIVDRYVETEIEYVLRNGEYMVSNNGSQIMYKRSKVVDYGSYTQECVVCLTLTKKNNRVYVKYESALIEGSKIHYSYYVDNQPLKNSFLVHSVLETLNL